MIGLVIPPSPFLLDERVFVSLGVLRVAAALEAAGHGVAVVDLSGVRDYEAAMVDAVREMRADTYGITTTTPQFPAAARAARVIQDQAPEARVIIGGPHVTMAVAAVRTARRRGEVSRAEAALAELGVVADVLVAGDGERAVFAALEMDAPKLVDADDPRSPMFLSGALPPWPARHLVDLQSYHYRIDGEPACSIISQLGCPYGCAFCGGRASPSFRRARVRPPADVRAELSHLRDAYGYRAFMCYDDELNVSPALPELLAELTEEQDARGEGWGFRGFLKSERVTRAQADALHAAGFRWVLVGFESGSDRILRAIRKGATRDDNTRAMEMCREAGLRVKALMSLGHAGESPETVAATRDWLLGVRPDDLDITVITPYPGSPYHDEARPSGPGRWTYTARGGDMLHMEAVDYVAEPSYYKGVPGGYVSHVWTDALSREELVAARDGMEAEVREKLGLPTYQPGPAVDYEHAMGQTSGSRSIE